MALSKLVCNAPWRALARSSAPPQQLVRISSCVGCARLVHSFNGECKEEEQGGSQRMRGWGLAGGILLGACGLALGSRNLTVQAATAPANETTFREAGQRIEGLKEYSAEDVRQHDSPENRIWVSYRNGVYDITDFVPLHPGADKVLMAAGGSVEPFWAMYSFHNKNQSIQDMLEEYRIGNLHEEEVRSQRDIMKDTLNPFANDPKRHHILSVNMKEPFNGEPPLSILTDSFITPVEFFFVRNHLPVPDVDVSSYQLEVTGMGVKKELNLSLEELQKFPKHTLVAAVQCAGNRRQEMNASRPLKGLEWRGGAIGNAEWAGAKLSDVLAAAGFDETQSPDVRHVQFEGLDVDNASSPYGASIPIEKAADPRGDVLLAYEMNGKPLSRDHGFPVRVLVPGVTGARNVKWLGRIVLSDEESESQWQRNDYKGFNPAIGWDTVDFSKSQAIQEMPVTSGITHPANNTEVQPGQMVEVSGYAWSGGGRKIIRVDLTADGGRTWTSAETLSQDTARHPRHWGWTLWKGQVRIPEGVSECQVWSKAVDSSYNVQPENVENIWNLRGVLTNSYFKIGLRVLRQE